MNLSTIRTRLRRRINDTASDTWTNANLLDIINEAIHDMQMDILAVNKEAILYRWRANIVSGQEEYSLPSGMLWENEVRVLDSTTSDYVAIERWSRRDQRKVLMDQLSLPSDSSYVYSIQGQSLFLGPEPTASVTSGLEIEGVPTLDVTDDTDVPELPISMHQIIVYRAELILKPEGNDDTKEAKEAIARWRENLPTFYRKSGRPDMFQVDINKSW